MVKALQLTVQIKMNDINHYARHGGQLWDGHVFVIEESKAREMYDFVNGVLRKYDIGYEKVLVSDNSYVAEEINIWSKTDIEECLKTRRTNKSHVDNCICQQCVMQRQ